MFSHSANTKKAESKWTPGADPAQTNRPQNENNRATRGCPPTDRKKRAGEAVGYCDNKADDPKECGQTSRSNGLMHSIDQQPVCWTKANELNGRHATKEETAPNGRTPALTLRKNRFHNSPAGKPRRTSGAFGHAARPPVGRRLCSRIDGRQKADGTPSGRIAHSPPARPSARSKRSVRKDGRPKLDGNSSPNRQTNGRFLPNRQAEEKQLD